MMTDLERRMLTALRRELERPLDHEGGTPLGEAFQDLTDKHSAEELAAVFKLLWENTEAAYASRGIEIPDYPIAEAEVWRQACNAAKRELAAVIEAADPRANWGDGWERIGQEQTLYRFRVPAGWVVRGDSETMVFVPDIGAGR